MQADVCPERRHVDSKHEWMPFRWVKDMEINTYGPAQMTLNAKNTVMRLGEVVCKYCLEKKLI